MMVVGTIHKYHLVSKHYPLSSFSRIIESYKPDLILVEIPVQSFQKHEYEDGPIEMTLIANIALQHQIPVAAIDWWNPDRIDEIQYPEGKTEKAEIQKANEEAEHAISNFDFASINGSETDRTYRELRNTEARLMRGNPTWNERQEWFHYNTLTAIRKTHPKRVLTFVGFEHKAELQLFMSNFGAHIESPIIFQRLVDSAPANESVSPETISAWQEELERLKAKSLKTKGKFKSRLEAKVHYFQAFIEHKGSCCIDEKLLQ